MKKIITLTLLLTLTIVLSSCSQAEITCGEGTIIKDGKCVAPDVVDDKEDVQEVSCDDMTGEIFYEADFDSLQSSFVDNEPGNLHNENNFVIWGKAELVQLVDNASVLDGVLNIDGLKGSQLDYYYDTGLGYQFFQFETDKTYSVCSIIEGTTGEKITSELGIYYGHGTKDQLTLTGDRQLILQDFRPTTTTNDNRGQYVIFTGNVEGELKIHQIKIVENE